MAASQRRVWLALRNPSEIRRWFGWDYEGLDHEIREVFAADVEVSEERGTLDTGGGRFELEPRGEQTLVRVVMGPRDDPRWQGMFAPIEQGWITFVHQLRFALERHPGEERRTLRMSGGEPRRPADPGWLATAEEWFRTERQLGLTVAECGDGLLVLTDRTALLSTYGLDDRSFAALRERFAGWWEQHHGEAPTVAPRR